MPLPSELLQAMDQSIQEVVADSGLNPQQLTFVNHLRKTTSELSKAVMPIPPTEHALRRIIPTFGDSFLQQQAALFGYARLLLEQPDSFGGEVLSEYQQDHMQRIYQHGQALYQLTEQIINAAQTERRQQHKAKPSRVQLDEFFAEEEAILRYIIQEKAIQLSLNIQAITVSVAVYHLAALIQHIVTVLSHELVEYGHIKISTAQHPQEATINIFCTGIQLDTNERDILFKKNGRYLYPQRIQKDGAHLNFSREHGRAATIHLILPLY